MRTSYPSTGADSSISSPLPCGTPSTTSTRTTSANSFAAIFWAVLAPTLPAPTTVTFLRITLLDELETLDGFEPAVYQRCRSAANRDSLQPKRLVTEQL